MMTWLTRLGRRAAGPIGLAVALVLLAAPAALASTPFADIHSAGPLSDIYIGNDLSCQVRDGGFSSTEFYPDAPGPGDCGTFVFTGSDDNTEELEGPDFANHAGGTHTTSQFSTTEVPFTPVSQTMTGLGTAASPYQVTTIVTASDPDPNGGPIDYQLTEVDTYIVGDNFYRSDVTVKNIGSNSASAVQDLYHVADCQLRGSDDGFGVAEPPSSPSTVACITTVVNSPPLEEFVPITPGGNNWMEASATSSPTIWSDLDGAFQDTCSPSCRVSSDNAMGIEWTLPGLDPGQTATFSFNTETVDTVPAGGFSFSGSPGTAVGGTVATITDPNTSATASTYTATINWGDGTTSTGTVTGGNGSFNVTGSHAYSTAGTYPVAVTITSVGTSLGSSTVTDSATINSPPSSGTTSTPTVGTTGVAFAGSVNPSGLATTAYFEYGLDPKYAGAGPLAYTQSTPVQSVGSDFTSHTVSASAGGLVPNALYHVRLLATNSAGTTVGPDFTFTTQPAPAPSPPTLGKTFNVSVVNGLVLVKIHGVFVPLTELTQIPTNTVIDALHGTIKLTTALPGGSHPTHDAAAMGKKKKPVKTQTGNFGGAIFKLTQATRGANKGLVNLALVESAFKGAPTYATCKAKKAGDATVASLSSKTLQLLHASAHGKFRTTGKYSAATVRGTKWTIGDKCNGTLTHDITDSVSVTDFVHHKTVILHAGQSYLARKP